MMNDRLAAWRRRARTVAKEAQNALDAEKEVLQQGEQTLVDDGSADRKDVAKAAQLLSKAVGLKPVLLR